MANSSENSEELEYELQKVYENGRKTVNLYLEDITIQALLHTVNQHHYQLISVNFNRKIEAKYLISNYELSKPPVPHTRAFL